MDDKLNEILDLLKSKSCTKQFVYRNTLELFQKFKKELQSVEQILGAAISSIDKNVEVKYSEKGPFEAQLKFSGDTLVFMMHTNVFDFDEGHIVNKNKYIKEDKMREYCGMIQVYNFLSDSIKYNRADDLGVLVARIFVNKDSHFFVEGKRPLSFMYSDISQHELNEQNVAIIVREAMLYCLRFDLLAPPVDAVSFISVDQKNEQSYSSGLPTSKRLGFQMSKDLEQI